MTGVVIVVLLLDELGSLVVEETEEFAVIEATVTLGARFTTTMMFADAPKAKVGSLQVTLPVPPTTGAVQVQPAGAETETNVVLVGTASRKLTAEAGPGPLFVTVCK
jgi:hypothetical protein